MKQNALKSPFFATLLEAQDGDVNPSKDPRPPIGKYPPSDNPQTMKYPSDGDDDYPKE